MVTDSIAELLTKLRNAQRAGHKVVSVHPYSMNKGILDVLKKEGFIEGYTTRAAEGEKRAQLEVVLKYQASGDPMIVTARRISKPGRRVYSAVESMPKVMQGLGISVVSTPKGVMSDRDARKQKVGGEVLAVVSC